MLHLQRVDPFKNYDILKRLQRECLPCDEIYDVSTGYWWIAYMDGTPIGFCGLKQLPQWPQTGYLCRAGVIPLFRGRGIQKRLIRVRMAYARRIGLENLVSDTHQNPASANSLIACGFKTYEPMNPWAFEDSIYWIHKL